MGTISGQHVTTLMNVFMTRGKGETYDGYKTWITNSMKEGLTAVTFESKASRTIIMDAFRTHEPDPTTGMAYVIAVEEEAYTEVMGKGTEEEVRFRFVGLFNKKTSVIVPMDSKEGYIEKMYAMMNGAA